MSYQGRYYLDTHESQQQGYHNFVRHSTSSQNVGSEDSYDALDPEKLMQCPYDKHHQIRACRFPYHLVKCAKNHPDIVQQLVTCPFNARHQVPKAEIKQHISSCDDKRCIEQDIASQVDRHRREINVVSSWQAPPCDEDWDKDLADQSNSIFVWGISRCRINSSGSSTTMGYKNHLASGLRAPRSLPFVLPWKNNAEN
ncbi:gametocyte-specific factor 1 [Elgaria multicarinata webbii]|uniref:gametocyte-specific factor 1 n=1 Tax=Elgaria multicarinata webbii TaxID=159646 RepID=UPI002FCD0752